MTPEPQPDIFEQLRRDTIGRIDQHGYTAIVVGTGDCAVPGCTCGPSPCPYAYSLGFCEHGHPEIVTFGLTLSAVNAVMNPVFEAVRAGTPLAVGRQHRHEPYGRREKAISLVPVPDLWLRRDPGRIGAWIEIFGSPLPEMVQVCWSDRRGRLPWESGCDPTVIAAQPLLADDPLRYPTPPRNRARHRTSPR